MGKIRTVEWEEDRDEWLIAYCYWSEDRADDPESYTYQRCGADAPNGDAEDASAIAIAPPYLFDEDRDVTDNELIDQRHERMHAS